MKIYVITEVRLHGKQHYKCVRLHKLCVESQKGLERVDESFSVNKDL